GTASDTTLGSYTPLTTIGAFDAAPNNVLKGKMDETTIFPYTLTADEVSYLYNGGAGRPYPFTSTTLGYYPMINLLGQGQIW
ncbi:hypothetical protein, partial [Lactococcus petauri]|uniref:hypothetical protein n=1 Tax=Lactococcus petauri TaxID=1940789 RepID=UPI0021F1B4E0